MVYPRYLVPVVGELRRVCFGDSDVSHADVVSHQGVKKGILVTYRGLKQQTTGNSNIKQWERECLNERVL